jgi:hypothetical protein
MLQIPPLVPADQALEAGLRTEMQEETAFEVGRAPR